MRKVVDEVGKGCIAGICADNAANMQAALDLVSLNFPNIEMLGCGSHQLNLAAKDILSLPVMKKTLDETITVLSWFRNHHVALAMLRQVQRQKFGKTIALTMPVPTRWQ